MDNQKATENSTLTYTLGDRTADSLLDYLDILFKFVEHFTANLKTLRDYECSSKSSWAKCCIKHPTTLREHVYYAALHNDQTLDSTPVRKPDYSFEKYTIKPTERQDTFFAWTMNCCINLADDLIILEILMDQYRHSILEPLEAMDAKHNGLINQLQDLKNNCPTDEESLNDLIATYLTPLEREVKRNHWPIKQYSDSFKAIDKYYRYLCSIAFPDVQELNQIWSEVCAKSLKIEHASPEKTAAFRNEIYQLRIKVYEFRKPHHSQLKKSELSSDTTNKVALLIHTFKKEYEQHHQNMKTARTEQSLFIPIIEKAINFIQISAQQQQTTKTTT